MRALAASASEHEGVGALLDLLGNDLPKPEHKFVASALAPLYMAAQPVSPEEWSVRPVAFGNFLRSRLDCLGWGPALSWEAQGGLFVPRKPTALVRLFCLGGISETSASFSKMVVNSPSWLELRPIDLPGQGFREEADAVMGAGHVSGRPVDAAALREARARTASQLVDEIECTAWR